MAGKGPAPAENVRRQNKERFEELPTGAKTRAPALPKTYKTSTGQVTFLKSARDWYRAWTTAPMAVKFTAVDWERLQRLARIVDSYDRDPDPKLLAEIRLQEAAYGGSPLDRRRLGITIATRDPAAQPASGRQRAPRPSARRARLSVVK